MQLYIFQIRIITRTAFFLLLFGSVNGFHFVDQGMIREVSAAPLGAMLTIPLLTHANLESVAPVTFRFQSFGDEVAGLTFSIDYDPTCLSFSSVDSDNNRLPDAVHFALPSQFRASASYDLTDADGELDFVIADFSPPLDVLVDTNSLLTIDFTPICAPLSSEGVVTDVKFSVSPSATFSDTQGQSIDGSVSDGSVVIYPALPTSTVTPTPIQTPTVPLQSTATPTLTPTPTITTPLLLTTTPTATVTPQPAPSRRAVYLPFVRR